MFFTGVGNRRVLEVRLEDLLGVFYNGPREGENG